MKKRVWILNHHANSMYFDEGGRHYNFAKYLKRQGYEPVIFCSNAEHGTGKLYFDNNKIWQEHLNQAIDVPFIFIKGRPYIGNGKNRVLCMVDYYTNVKRAAIEYAGVHGKPDIIIGSQVHPLAVLAGEQLAKKFHVKCIAEFRDLWPESIVAMGIAKKNNPVVIAMRILEKHLYKMANTIIFTVEGGYDYILERHWEKVIPKEKVFYINNGVDLEKFWTNVQENRIDDEDLNDADHFKVIYAGSIRRANGLDELLDSAALLKNNEKIRFLIYGDGDYLEELKKKVAVIGLRNVRFKEKIEKKSVPYLLTQSDLNLLNYNAAAAAGFYRFGSSQNKLFEYFASGKPVLSNFRSGYDLIEQYHCGISRNVLDAQQYVDALLEMVNMNGEEYQRMCQNAKEAAAEFDFKILTRMLIDVIESV